MDTMLKELDWCESCDTVRERERERNRFVTNGARNRV